MQEYTYKGTKIRVYRLGTWYHPCSFSHRRCHIDVSLHRAIGLQDTSDKVGLHHYTATWIRGLDHSLGISSIEEARKDLCADV